MFKELILKSAGSQHGSTIRLLEVTAMTPFCSMPITVTGRRLSDTRGSQSICSDEGEVE